MDQPKKKKEKQPEPLLRTVQGGKSGDGNWLLGLAEGTVFLTKPLKAGKIDVEIFECLQFHVMKKGRRYVYLLRNFFTQEQNILVDSISFSNMFELIEIQYDGHREDIQNTGSDTVENNVIDLGEHKIL